MLRSLSQLFNGPVVNDKGGEAMAEPMDEASTAPGSSGEEASEGADASLPSDGASDVSNEEPACGEGQPGTEGESAEVPETPVCVQAAVAGACVAVEGPICVDTTERRRIQIEESDENGERGVELAVASATVDDAAVARGSPVRRPTPVSQTGDGQARRRALKRYKLYESGQFVRRRPGDGGRWLAEPGAADALGFEPSDWYGLVWPAVEPLPEAWLEQGLSFSEPSQELIQPKNGPCGVMAVVQAVIAASALAAGGGCGNLRGRWRCVIIGKIFWLRGCSRPSLHMFHYTTTC